MSKKLSRRQFQRLATLSLGCGPAFIAICEETALSEKTAMIGIHKKRALPSCRGVQTNRTTEEPRILKNRFALNFLTIPCNDATVSKSSPHAPSGRR